MGTSSLEATILDFPLPVRTCNVLDCSVGLLDLKNMDMAFEIVFLSCLQAMGTFGLKAAILDFHFRFRRTAFLLIPLDGLTPKT